MNHVMMEETVGKSVKPTVYTEFRGRKLTPEEQDGKEHLMNMMLMVKKQIILRRAMQPEKRC